MVSHGLYFILLLQSSDKIVYGSIIKKSSFCKASIVDHVQFPNGEMNGELYGNRN